MPQFIVTYVKYVDAANRYVGLFAMYLIFAMIGILFYSAIMKAVSVPPLWTLEMAQFTMVAYYLLGGGHSLQLDAHVRMDLLYTPLSDRAKSIIDSVTILFLIFYLVMLIYGGVSSSIYAIEYGERSFSVWRPYMAPIKIIMVVGVVLMLLQAVATFFKDFAKARGVPLS